MLDKIGDIKTASEHGIKLDSQYICIASALADHCSGGGFDCAWYFKDQGCYVKAYTEWHLLDNRGYYLGYYGFTVIIPKKSIGNFRWYGVGNSKRILQRYGVDDYIEQEIYAAFEERGLI